MRARRFNPGFVLRIVSAANSGAVFRISGAEVDGTSEISAVAGGLGVLAASIFCYSSFFPSEEVKLNCSHLHCQFSYFVCFDFLIALVQMKCVNSEYMGELRFASYK